MVYDEKSFSIPHPSATQFSTWRLMLHTSGKLSEEGTNEQRLTEKEPAMQISQGRVSQGRRKSQYKSPCTLHAHSVYDTSGASSTFFMPYVSFGSLLFFHSIIGWRLLSCYLYIPFFFSCCPVLQIRDMQWFLYPSSSWWAYRLFPVSCSHIIAARQILDQAPSVYLQEFISYRVLLLVLYSTWAKNGFYIF